MDRAYRSGISARPEWVGNGNGHIAAVARPRPDSAPDERTRTIVERRRRGETIRDRGWLVRRALLAADVVALTLAFALVEVVVGDRAQGDRYSTLPEIGFFFAILPLWVVVAKLQGLYDRDEDRADNTTADDLIGVVHVVTLGTWLVYAIVAVTGLASPELGKVFFFWGAAIMLITLARAVARAVCRRQPAYHQNTLIVGAGEVGQLVAAKLLQHPEFGINIVGFVDSAPKAPRDDIAQIPLLGPPESLSELVREYGVERVIFAFSSETHTETLKLMRTLKEFDLRVDIVPRLFELVPPSADIHLLEGVPLIGLPRPGLSRSSLLLKRALDAGIAIGLLVLLAPLFLLVALLIKLDTRGSVFFRQLRMGQGEEAFSIYKFRTMVVDAEAQKSGLAHLNKHAQNGGDPRMFKIPHDPRVTRIGSLLRRTSLDELPQLWNVLRGEMSLVGPRPLIPSEHGHVGDWGLSRLDLKPGITGLWQVLGRDSIPFEEMVRLDYLYVTTWSLWGDLWLLLRTFPVLFKGEREPVSVTPA